MDRPRAPATRAAAALVVVLAAGAALAVAGAGPAAAHDLGGPSVASDYRSTVLGLEGAGLEGPGSGVTARVVGNDGLIELVNRSEATVVVLGYEGEPYLRLGPDGVEENVRSPAVALNRSPDGAVEPPPDADASVEPEWRRVGTGPVARWHDHRTHWMSPFPPPVVDEEPDVAHVLLPRWEVPIEVGGEPAAVVGELVWVPPPSGSPWWALTAALGLVTGALVLTRWWRAAVAVAAGLLLVAAWSDVAGVWSASVEPALDKASGLLTLAIATVVLVAGAVVVARRASGVGLALVVAGAALVALDHGVVGWAYLSSSQLASDLAPDLARLTVVVAVGVGWGTVVGGLLRLVLRRPVPAVAA